MAHKTIDVHEAKNRLLQLADEAAAGVDVVASRNGEPLERITQLATKRRQVRFGILEGKLEIHPNFDAPLDAAMLVR